MPNYRCLNQNIFTNRDYSLVPIRMEDRYDIMRWRNEQIYHLRQKEPLTEAQQDRYFEDVVSKLFDQEEPDQILFSFLEGEQLIGYGGLVHINWEDRNAEVSFVLDTRLETDFFAEKWKAFLSILKAVSFKQLYLTKIYTFAFDLRPKLYALLEDLGFKEEARLVNHRKTKKGYVDVLIHSFWNPIDNISYRPAEISDIEILYVWVNDDYVRKNSIQSDLIKYDEHSAWFQSRIVSLESKIYIFRSLDVPIGQVRLDRDDDFWILDYSVDANYRGLGIGFMMLKTLTENLKVNIKAIVKKSNHASVEIFKKLRFEILEDEEEYFTFYTKKR